MDSFNGGMSTFTMFDFVQSSLQISFVILQLLVVIYYNMNILLNKLFGTWLGLF